VILGYARVSTDGQTLDAQQSALSAAGAERVFAEKISGAVTDRKALARAIATLGPGDVFLVTRLDRLAMINSGLVECVGRGWEGWGGFQVAGRYLGRHHNASWEVNAERAWWPCRI
jgi:Resolvase, N terminal domain